MAKFEILSEGVIVNTASSKGIPYTAYKKNNLYCPTYSEVTSSKYFTDPTSYRLTVKKPEGMGSYKDNELIWNLGFSDMLKKRTVEYKEEYTDGNIASALGGDSCGHVKVTKIEKLDNIINSQNIILDQDVCKTWSENTTISARSEVKSVEYTKEDGTKGTVSCTLKQAAGTITTAYSITLTPTTSSLTAAGGTVTYTVVSTKVVTTNGKPVTTYPNATISTTGGTLSATSVSGNSGTFTLNIPANSGNITVTATNSGDTTKKATATVTVASKAISKIESNNDTTLNYDIISKDGGSVSPTVNATFKVTYTDGTSQNVNADSYSYSSTYTSLNTTTGVVTKSSANEETTLITVCNVTVTPSYNGTNGQTATSPVYLAASDVVTPPEPSGEVTIHWNVDGGLWVIISESETIGQPTFTTITGNQTTTCALGDKLTYPAYNKTGGKSDPVEPSRDGYLFDGWITEEYNDFIKRGIENGIIDQALLDRLNDTDKYIVVFEIKKLLERIAEKTEYTFKAAWHKKSEGSVTTYYTTTFKIENGTWANGSDADDIRSNPYDSKIDVPTGMIPYDGYDDGYWNPDISGQITVSSNRTYTYTFTKKDEPEPEDQEETTEVKYYIHSGRTTCNNPDSISNATITAGEIKWKSFKISSQADTCSIPTSAGLTITLPIITPNSGYEKSGNVINPSTNDLTIEWANDVDGNNVLWGRVSVACFDLSDISIDKTETEDDKNILKVEVDSTWSNAWADVAYNWSMGGTPVVDNYTPDLPGIHGIGILKNNHEIDSFAIKEADWSGREYEYEINDTVSMDSNGFFMNWTFDTTAGGYFCYCDLIDPDGNKVINGNAVAFTNQELSKPGTWKIIIRCEKEQ